VRRGASPVVDAGDEEARCSELKTRVLQSVGRGGEMERVVGQWLGDEDEAGGEDGDGTIVWDVVDVVMSRFRLPSFADWRFGV